MRDLPWLLRVTAEKPPNPIQDCVLQNAIVMPLNEYHVCVVYRARSLGLIEAGELLLEHVKEVLPVRHFV